MLVIAASQASQSFFLEINMHGKRARGVKPQGLEPEMIHPGQYTSESVNWKDVFLFDWLRSMSKAWHSGILVLLNEYPGFHRCAPTHKVLHHTTQVTARLVIQYRRLWVSYTSLDRCQISRREEAEQRPLTLETCSNSTFAGTCRRYLQGCIPARAVCLQRRWEIWRRSLHW